MNHICTKLETKFNSFASFQVTVTLPDTIFDHVLGVLNSANIWPENALVRKFFFPKSHD